MLVDLLCVSWAIYYHFPCDCFFQFILTPYLISGKSPCFLKYRETKSYCPMPL